MHSSRQILWSPNSHDLNPVDYIWGVIESRVYETKVQDVKDFRQAVAAGRGRGRAADRAHFAGTSFEGRKFAILAFALQCASTSLYLFSALRMVVAGWMGGTTDLCPGRHKPSRRH